MSSTKPAAPGFVPEIPRRQIDLPGGPLRRPGTTPQRPAAGSGESKKLVVGREISLSGEITACDSLIVEGSVEATLENSRYLEIAEGGVFKGCVQIDEAVIAGLFEGTLVVRDRLSIKASGQITGEVSFGKLEVELGGEIIGRIGILTEEPGSSEAGSSGGHGGGTASNTSPQTSSTTEA